MSVSPPTPSDETLENSDPDHSSGLYQHKSRPDWGLAILAWDKGDKRGYQFDDGVLRIIKRGFYGLFEEVEPPEGDANALVRDLNLRLKESRESSDVKETRTPLKPVYPFSSQLEIFGKLYPEGFRGAAWQDTVRGSSTTRRLKRHRNPAIAMASELMDRERMKSAIDEGHHASVLEDAIKLMKASSLVSSKNAEAVRGSADTQVQLAESLFELLHGDQTYLSRFEDWLEALRKANRERPRWDVATAIPAMFSPEHEVCLSLTVFKKQAGSVAPEVFHTPRARRRSYKGLREVAKTVKRKLEEAGYHPADLMDVFDFISLTLKPSAASHLAG